MSAAWRTNDSPTYSTACSAVQSRSSRSFSVRASTLSAAPGTLIPWCDRIRPGSVTFSRAQPGPRSITSMATVPSAKRTALADLEVVGQRRVGAGQLVGIVGTSGSAARQNSAPKSHSTDVAGDRPQADLGPAQVLQHRELAAHLLADRAGSPRAWPSARRGCRARS